eukprot:Rhum_TRINITY_DN14287_c14_g1::Rhum_TRINITY_DN14287_c14_g1_i1::g.77546::m.77546
MGRPYTLSDLVEKLDAFHQYAADAGNEHAKSKLGNARNILTNANYKDKPDLLHEKLTEKYTDEDLRAKLGFLLEWSEDLRSGAYDKKSDRSSSASSSARGGGGGGSSRPASAQPSSQAPVPPPVPAPAPVSDAGPQLEDEEACRRLKEFYEKHRPDKVGGAPRIWLAYNFKPNTLLASLVQNNGGDKVRGDLAWLQEYCDQHGPDQTLSKEHREIIRKLEKVCLNLDKGEERAKAVPALVKNHVGKERELANTLSEHYSAEDFSFITDYADRMDARKAALGVTSAPSTAASGSRPQSRASQQASAAAAAPAAQQASSTANPAQLDEVIQNQHHLAEEFHELSQRVDAMSRHSSAAAQQQQPQPQQAGPAEHPSAPHSHASSGHQQYAPPHAVQQHPSQQGRGVPPQNPTPTLQSPPPPSQVSPNAGNFAADPSVPAVTSHIGGVQQVSSAGMHVDSATAALIAAGWQPPGAGTTQQQQQHP